MPAFRANRPITTREPFVQVDAGLKPGEYRFQLVVTDDDGLRSEPTVLLVTVQDIPINPRDPEPI